VTKHNFDQTPVLLETFDQLIRSSEIRSTDPLSNKSISASKEKLSKRLILICILFFNKWLC
jgi:hypothetical protein